jgi:exopolysaccharide biosynthesis predicted pyruvyltransferase EpsI
MRGNIGDHLIWAGTSDLLDHSGVHYETLAAGDVTSGRFPRGDLLIHGSGAFDARWHEWLPELVLEASDRFHAVIILPSSFDPAVPVVARCLSRPNVFAFAREVRSYRAIKSFGRAALSFDCAVYYHRFADRDDTGAPRAAGDDVLLALREDEGSLLALHGVAANPARNDDISLTRTSLDDWLGAIAAADAVVTDRLHVAVAGVLLGKAVTYLDPYDGKISTYASYTFRDAFESGLRPCSVEWLRANDLVVDGHRD